MHDCDLLKFIYHRRKIIGLQQPNEPWFHDVLQLSGMRGLYKIDYVMVNHDMLNTYANRWYTETSSFYLPHGEMSITLDDISCLLHLLILGETFRSWKY